MCQKHLCGEHVEMHMFLGSLKQGKKIKGYLEKNLFEPMVLKYRHDELSKEMIRRGYNHKSPINLDECKHVFSLPSWERLITIDKEKALGDLLNRCPECKKRSKDIEVGL
jgi:hypothetical protein